MSRVSVKPNILQWAIDRSGRSAGDLSGRFPVREWLAGSRDPTLKQLEEFAKATSTPFGMLFLDEPPDETLPVALYRTISDTSVRRPSADLLDTIHAMQRRQDWMRDYLIDIGQPPLPIVGSARASENIRDVAKRIRDAMRLDEAWASRSATWEDAFRVLRDSMERAGILVFSNGIVGSNTHRVLIPDEFRGFVLVDKYAPAVFVNAADAKAAQMFTLAHELAHVFYGISAAFDLKQLTPAQDDMEQTCNRVAAEVLVPEAAIKRETSVSADVEQQCQQLARRFKVSTIVAARRLLDVGQIDRESFVKFYRSQMARFQAQKKASEKTGGNFYASLPFRIGDRFGKAVVRALREGRIEYTEAYSLTGLRGNTFQNYAAEVTA